MRTVEVSADVRDEVDCMIADALGRLASDIHIEPTSEGYEIRFRIDGLLKTFGRRSLVEGRTFVGRLMVMAHLLTYRPDVPQEGRIEFSGRETEGRIVALRVAVMPTTHGPRAAVRLPAELAQPRPLEQLGLPGPVVTALKHFAAGDCGMLIVTGPAGSGKTTTLYALLRYMGQAYPGTSLIALEDPVECDLPGVTQIEVKPFGELTYERALRSILRQDPQVLMLGEVRDAATASLAVQAALSGHRLLCTLHGGAPAEAIARLTEMGVEPYQVTSALFGILSQRLLRRRAADGGYLGRVPVAEMALLDGRLRRAILQREDVGALRQAIVEAPGYATLRDAARELIESGITDAAGAQRVLGPTSE